jgi:hypothetical protein
MGNCCGVEKPGIAGDASLSSQPGSPQIILLISLFSLSFINPPFVYISTFLDNTFSNSFPEFLQSHLLFNRCFHSLLPPLFFPTKYHTNQSWCCLLLTHKKSLHQNSLLSIFLPPIYRQYLPPLPFQTL